jgi:hypothetical protein
MATGILALLAALVPFVIWLIKRRVAVVDDPKTQHEKRYEKIDEGIAATIRDPRSALRVSADASDDLDELERLRLAKPKTADRASGSNGDTSAGGAGVHPK